MAIQKPQSTLLQSDESWMTTEEAADLLCVTSAVLPRMARGKIKEMVRSTRGHGPVGSGYLWCRREVEYVAELRKKSHLSLSSALRVMVSVRDAAFDLNSISL